MRYEPQSITVEPALGKQPARLLALTLCERSGDLGIPVRQIRGEGTGTSGCKVRFEWRSGGDQASAVYSNEYANMV